MGVAIAGVFAVLILAIVAAGAMERARARRRYEWWLAYQRTGGLAARLWRGWSRQPRLTDRTAERRGRD